MQKTGKPFLIIINSREPNSEGAKAVCHAIQSQYGVRPVVADCQALDEDGIRKLLKALLHAFPMTAMKVYLPRWLDALEEDHPVRTKLYRALLDRAEKIKTLGQAEEALGALSELEEVEDYTFKSMDMADGTVSVMIRLPEGMYYDILSSKAGMPIENEAQLLSLLMELSKVKREYDQIADALSSVKATGYGVVKPTAADMKLEKPEIVKRGGSYGVKLKAGAPSIHMVRVDVDTEISPMVGDEKQSRDLINHLTGDDPELLWQSNIFGKSVHDMIQEGMNAKLLGMSDDVRGKFRGTLTRIVNEGATGLICLIL